MIQHILEKHTLFTPLGIRFWDVTAGRVIKEGLIVTAREDGKTAPANQAFVTGSGIFAFKGLPGLREIEFGTSVEDLEAMERKRFIIDVSDIAGYFVPISFSVDVPLEEQGVFPSSPATAPADQVPGFPLFSSVSRPKQNGWAVVRAQITESDGVTPASHAVLRLEIDGQEHMGIADKAGHVAVMFPYPPIRESIAGSVPENRIALHEHTWEMNISVQYSPATRRDEAGGGRPLITDIIDQLEASAPLNQSSLRYGVESILVSENQSSLLIEPGTA